MNKTIYEDHLAHYGRLGMHWGERNGPPYPLGKSQLSSSEKRVGKNTNSINEKHDDDYKDKIRKEKIKKAIVIGSVAMGAALVVGGALVIGGLHLPRPGDGDLIL